MNFISSVAWVPRGLAKPLPDEVKLDADQLKELFAEQAADEPDVEPNESDDEEQADEPEEEPEEEPDEKGEADADWQSDDEEVEAKGSGFAVSSLSVFPTNDQDPYVKVKDDQDVDSEDQDFRILPDDNLIAVAHVDEDASILEVYVYNEKNDDLYVHHDVILPAYPLAVEWLSYQPGGTEDGGNYVAIGSMETTVQIWDLDVVNALEPTYELKSRKRKMKADQEDAPGVRGHSDAVLCLAWNTLVPHILASGSADGTCVLWDLDTGKPSTVLKGFEDKVQSIRWRPDHAEQLLCGSCDGTVRLFDCHFKKAKSTVWKISGEVERVLWSPSNSSHFFVTDNSGVLYWFDVLSTETYLTSVQAHGKAVTGLTCSRHVPGLFITASEDKRVKVWDIHEESEEHVIKEVFERKLKMGELQFATISPDSPFKVALAGDDSDNIFRILDLYKISSEVQERFATRMPEELRARLQTDVVAEPNKKEQLIGKRNPDVSRQTDSAKPPKDRWRNRPTVQPEAHGKPAFRKGKPNGGDSAKTKAPWKGGKNSSSTQPHSAGPSKRPDRKRAGPTETPRKGSKKRTKDKKKSG